MASLEEENMALREVLSKLKEAFQTARTRMMVMEAVCKRHQMWPEVEKALAEAGGGPEYPSVRGAAAVGDEDERAAAAVLPGMGGKQKISPRPPDQRVHGGPANRFAYGSASLNKLLEKSDGGRRLTGHRLKIDGAVHGDPGERARFAHGSSTFNATIVDSTQSYAAVRRRASYHSDSRARREMYGDAKKERVDPIFTRPQQKYNKPRWSKSKNEWVPAAQPATNKDGSALPSTARSAGGGNDDLFATLGRSPEGRHFRTDNFRRGTDLHTGHQLTQRGLWRNDPAKESAAAATQAIAEAINSTTTTTAAAEPAE